VEDVSGFPFGMGPKGHSQELSVRRPFFSRDNVLSRVSNSMDG